MLDLLCAYFFPVYMCRVLLVIESRILTLNYLKLSATLKSNYFPLNEPFSHLFSCYLKPFFVPGGGGGPPPKKKGGVFFVFFFV